MLRILARFLGFWFVAAALVAAVVDGAKSIAASGIVLTPVAESYTTLMTIGRPQPATVDMPTAPWPLDLPLAWLMASPTVLILAVLGVALLVLGARRRRPFLSREFAA